MPRERRALFNQVNEAVNTITERLTAVTAALRNMPTIPPLGGQAFHNTQRAWLVTNLHPLVNDLIGARTRLGDGLTGLDEYLVGDKSSGGKDEARVFLVSKREDAHHLDQRIRAAFVPVPQEHGDPVEQLIALLDH